MEIDLSTKDKDFICPLKFLSHATTKRGAGPGKAGADSGRREGSSPSQQEGSRSTKQSVL